MTKPVKFPTVVSKPHREIAGEMAQRIKDLIYEYTEHQNIPLALAVGVLTLVQREIIEEAE